MKGTKQSPVSSDGSTKDSKGRTASKLPRRMVTFKTPAKKMQMDGTFLVNNNNELPSITEEVVMTPEVNPRLAEVGITEVGKDSLDYDWLTANSRQDSLLVNDSTESRLGNSNPSTLGLNLNPTTPGLNSNPSTPGVDSNPPTPGLDWRGSIHLPGVKPLLANMRHRHGRLSIGGLDGSLGKLITEEDLLDTIFYSCDVDKVGRVSPSVLLEYVKMIMLSSHLDDTPNMEELAQMLDPSDMDLPIDLPTYQRAITKWIEDIQGEDQSLRLINLSSEEEGEPPPLDDLPVTSTPMIPPDQRDKPWTSRRAFSQTLRDDNALPSPLDAPIPCFSYGSSNANSVEISSREREADLVSQLEDLRFQVRKLTDQNNKLQLQLEGTEENNTHLLSELDTIQTKLRSSAVVIQRSMSVREQNEELHTEVKDLEGCRSDIEKKYKAVVEERDVLQVKLKNLTEEVEQAYENIDEQKQSMSTMQETLNKLQMEYQEAEEKIALQTVELAEKSMQFEEMQEQTKELLASKEILKTENDHLEEKVDELKQEIALACQVPPNDVEFMQSPEEEGEMDCSTMMVPPVTSSTPYKQPIDPLTSVSIYSELKAVSTGTSLPPVYGILPVDDSLQSSSLGQQPDVAVEMVAKMKKKKEMVLEEVRGIMGERTEESDTAPVNSLSKEVMTCINKEMDQILDEMKSVARAKHVSDERAKKLAKLLAEITDEKATLIRQHEEALGKLHQLNYDQQQLELIRTENEILEHSIEHEKSRLSLMNQRLKDCQVELKESREKEVGWKRKFLEKKNGINLVDSIPQYKGPDQDNFSYTPLIDALSLEGHRLPSQRYSIQGSHPLLLGRESAFASPDRLPPYREPHYCSSPLSNSRHQARRRRAKSEESPSFVTACDTPSNLSSTWEEYRTAAGNLSARSTSFDFPEFHSARRDLSGAFSFPSAVDTECETSFDSAVESLDRNYCESPRLARGGSETNYHGNRNPRGGRQSSVLQAVKILCEIGVQTVPAVDPPSVPASFGASRHKSEKFRRRSLPRLHFPRSRSFGQVSELIPPTSSPTSPLLKIPRLLRAESPYSEDSDNSGSSQFSFKTAPSSPKSFNSSREADVSSDGPCSLNSSLADQPEHFQTCTTEGELALQPGKMKRMAAATARSVDENCNKSDSEGGESSSSSAFSPVPRSSRKPFDRERSYSARTFDEEGCMIDLISADLDEEPLTEADKEINAKLIKESQLASERFWNRPGRKNGDQPKTGQSPSSPETKRSHSDVTGNEKQDFHMDDEKKELQEIESPHQHPSEASLLPRVPELTEASETEESAVEADKQHPSDPEDMRVPEEEKMEAPPPLKRKRSAILTDALLKKLGLVKGGRDPLNMTDKEVEMRFKDLSLALKSSLGTLEKRVELQRRERDLAEENMGKELDGLLGSIQRFDYPDPDNALYHHATKLKQQVKMLQTMKVNLASKSEGLGQVIQEKRISTACEVMVKYVDNLRGMLEIKQGELEEAKKLIQDNRLLYRPSAATSEDVRSRRVSSVVPGKFNQSTRLGATLSSAAWKKLVQDEGRRRASVAVLNLPTQQQDSRGRFHSFASSVRPNASAAHRPITRAVSSLQDFRPSLLTDKSFGNPVGKSVSFSGGTRPAVAISPLAKENLAKTTAPAEKPEESKEKQSSEKTTTNTTKDDENYRIGFQQGVQNQVTQELEDLREQQRLMVENLEELIDSMEEDDKEDVVANKAPSYPQLSNFFIHPVNIPWVKVQKLARLTATFLLVLAACCSVIFTLMPSGAMKVGAVVSESPFSTIQQFFWPYTSLVHSAPPPR